MVHIQCNICRRLPPPTHALPFQPASVNIMHWPTCDLIFRKKTHQTCRVTNMRRVWSIARVIVTLVAESSRSKQHSWSTWVNKSWRHEKNHSNSAGPNAFNLGAQVKSVLDMTHNHRVISGWSCSHIPTNRANVTALVTPDPPLPSVFEKKTTLVTKLRMCTSASSLSPYRSRKYSYFTEKLHD